MQIELLSGEIISGDNIKFDKASHRFSLDGRDITANLRRADKEGFDGFDVETDNLRLYNERYAREHDGKSAPPTGSTSTLGIFTEQLLTDPLDAPLDALDAAVDKVTDSSGLKTVAVAVVVIAALGLIIYANKP